MADINSQLIYIEQLYRNGCDEYEIAEELRLPVSQVIKAIDANDWDNDDWDEEFDGDDVYRPAFKYPS